VTVIAMAMAIDRISIVLQRGNGDGNDRSATINQ
jgi:hypothetical protein